MTEEQKAAFIMAQAAVLNAQITGMIAENYMCMYNQIPIHYDEAAFKALVDASPCNHNAVVTFFGGF